jgi:hypothetical protein
MMKGMCLVFCLVLLMGCASTRIGAIPAGDHWLVSVRTMDIQAAQAMFNKKCQEVCPGGYVVQDQRSGLKNDYLEGTTWYFVGGKAYCK